MRNYIPQQQRFDNFSDLIEAAATKYTLSFKDACKALKCSRSWAQKYIRPNVPNIYLANGKGTKKVNYAKIVSQKVKQQNGKSGYSNESVYLDEEAFNRFIINSIITCQKRSKRAYKTYFIEESCLEAYYKELLALYSRFFCEKLSKEDIEKLWHDIDTLYLKYAKNDYVKAIIHPAIVHATKRTEASFVDVPAPSDVPITEWQAVHDLMDYGDIEETIYRDLFKKGYIRVEIKLPDKNGEIKGSGKVYYISDPEPIHQTKPDEAMINRILKSDTKSEEIKNLLENLIIGDTINIKQSSWVEYNNMLGNSITY